MFKSEKKSEAVSGHVHVSQDHSGFNNVPKLQIGLNKNNIGE